MYKYIWYSNFISQKCEINKLEALYLTPSFDDTLVSIIYGTYKSLFLLFDSFLKGSMKI